MRAPTPYYGPTNIDLARELADLAIGLSRHLRYHSATASSMSSMEASTLLSIYENPDITSAELARHFRVTPQSMRPWVLGLIDKGMIQRTSDGRDKRAYSLTVTSLGKAFLLQEGESHTADLARNIKAHFSIATQEQLLEAVRQLKTLLRDTQPPVSPDTETPHAGQ